MPGGRTVPGAPVPAARGQAGEHSTSKLKYNIPERIRCVPKIPGMSIRDAPLLLSVIGSTSDPALWRARQKSGALVLQY